ncbi:hypothetical protein [Flavobacterium frigoris]|uniref:Uncharacterized protein n=1 Tax=Flavobacterium frigoris (strain PS1) TaxID=1086011 RepID=H7FLH2_FLAFP|nr:hypothetical protein [Flavobacterium frigoris]EIA10514.1 hypothetical protein HJ01_00020 [Flavobacterium frigoris PS1]
MSKENTLEKLSEKVGFAINSIPLKTAQKWAKRWTQREGKYNKHHELNAFLIPAVDLKELLEEGGTHVRAYIGVQKVKAEQKGDKPTYIEKLMFVGTKYNPETKIYEDLITTPGKDVSVGEQADDIYDFTKPCPPYNDPSSPLEV